MKPNYGLARLCNQNCAGTDKQTHRHADGQNSKNYHKYENVCLSLHPGL